MSKAFERLITAAGRAAITIALKVVERGRPHHHDASGMVSAQRGEKVLRYWMIA